KIRAAGKPRKTDGKRPANLISSPKTRTNRGTRNGTAKDRVSKTRHSTPQIVAAQPPPSVSVPVTILEAKIDVGYGNTLFIRGEGPGLSWAQGTPMTCM